MNIAEKLIAIIAPHHCCICDDEGDVICAACSKAINFIPERCYRCHRSMPNSLTCPSCRKSSLLRHVWSVTEYDALAKDLIKMFKFDGVRAAAISLAVLMAQTISGLEATELTYIVHIPTAANRKRQRGYDQSELLARELSRCLNVPYRPMLRRFGNSRQVGSSRADRLVQLKDAFQPRHKALIRGAHIILVDDVTTTGATLETAARILKSAGAKQVVAVTFAQA